ncbi:MAG: NrtR DNA-binding winged helix domain-containing protein [Fibrobacterota bacterium]|nr:NUDIX domain-containing protein [Chitinispirillaceae bacterium]
MSKLTRTKEQVSSYDKNAYERPSVTVDVAVCTYFDSNLHILLVKRTETPFNGYWAIPGGFVDVDKRELLEETAIRKLYEETSLRSIQVEQLKTYGDPDRDPRMRVITVAYFALVPYNSMLDSVRNNTLLRWFPICKIPRDCAFDHKQIINDLLTRLQGRISYSPIAFKLLESKFTWCELQCIYETILDKKLLTPNFRRKINSMYQIIELDETQKSGGRPSRLLMFNGEKSFE